MNTTILRHLALAGALAPVASCKPSTPSSGVSSGFVNGDCKSLYSEYELHWKKLETLRPRFVEAWEAFERARLAEAKPQGGNPLASAGGEKSPGLALTDSGEEETTATGTGSGTATSTTAGDAKPSGGDGETPAAEAKNLDKSFLQSFPCAEISKPDDKGLLPAELTAARACIKVEEGKEDPPTFAFNEEQCAKYYLNPKDWKPDQKLYALCLEFHGALKRLDEVQTTYNKKRECYEGGYDKNKIPQLFAYCDQACTFAERVDCTRCDLSFKSPKGKDHTGTIICLGDYSTHDAAQTFCNRMASAGYTDCKATMCESKRGAEFASEAAPSVAGSSSVLRELQLSDFSAVEASVTVSGGVVSDAQASARGTLGGKIVLKKFNAEDNVFTVAKSGTPPVCRANSKVVCEVQVLSFDNIDASLAGGVGGSFKVFGNGVDARAVVRKGVSFVGTEIVTKSSEPVPCSGISEGAMFDQCMRYVIEWSKADLPGLLQKDSLLDKKFAALLEEAVKERDRIQAAENGARKDRESKQKRNIKTRQNGGCLTYTDDSNRVAFTEPCDGSEKQKFYMIEGADGVFTIKSAKSGLCLDRHHDRRSDPAGYYAYFFTCHGKSNQQFKYSAGDPHLVEQETGKPLDADTGTSRFYWSGRAYWLGSESHLIYFHDNYYGDAKNQTWDVPAAP